MGMVWSEVKTPKGTGQRTEEKIPVQNTREEPDERSTQRASKVVRFTMKKGQGV